MERRFIAGTNENSSAEEHIRRKSELIRSSSHSLHIDPTVHNLVLRVWWKNAFHIRLRDKSE